MKRLALLFLAVPLLMAGCKTSTTTALPLAPGAVNATDQAIYDGLMVAQAALTSLKASIPTNLSLKPYVNQAIADYNLAEASWQVYHTAVALNPSTSPAAAQAALAKVQTDLSTAPKVTQ